MRRFLILSIFMALIATLLIARLTTPAPSRAEDQPKRNIVTVGRGTVTTTVNATGRLAPQRELAIGFQVDGVVSEVLVVRGQSVVTGTPLARLDTTDLEMAVQKAQIDLDKANASLAKIKAAANSDEVASAKAALASAQAAYDQLVAGPNKDQITAAAADLRTAEVDLQNAQGAYDRVAWKGSVGASAEAAALEKATIAYQKALANYNLAQKPPTDAELKQAKAQIAQAKATLNNLLRGATPEDIALAEADIRSAQLALDSAKQNLARATLLAPISGVVTEIDIDVGARPGVSPIIKLAELSALHVSVPVDEIDLPSVKVGQPATIVLDAMPGNPLSGHVTDIAPVPQTTSDGATTYEVDVTLDQPNERIVTGMSGKVAIETQRRENVIVIPASLVQVDSKGNTYVEKLGPNGQPVQVPVTLGLRSGQMIEVRSGLAEGDQVLAPQQQQTQSNSTRRTGVFFPGPGLGGPPPGVRR